jgi:carboxyl-terminal processing protease
VRQRFSLQALRDAIGARIVGSKTYGRGQIQTYVALNDAAGIVIPAARVETMKGLRFSKGDKLTPDIIVPAAKSQSHDAVYRRAVDLLTSS